MRCFREPPPARHVSVLPLLRIWVASGVRRGRTMPRRVLVSQGTWHPCAFELTHTTYMHVLNVDNAQMFFSTSNQLTRQATKRCKNVHCATFSASLGVGLSMGDFQWVWHSPHMVSFTGPRCLVKWGAPCTHLCAIRITSSAGSVHAGPLYWGRLSFPCCCLETLYILQVWVFCRHNNCKHLPPFCGLSFPLWMACTDEHSYFLGIQM